jgi:hypothetical protein
VFLGPDLIGEFDPALAKNLNRFVDHRFDGCGDRQDLVPDLLLRPESELMRRAACGALGLFC